MQVHKFYKISFLFIVVLFLASCSVAKFVPDNEYYLKGVKINSDQKGYDATSLKPYIRQSPNSKWFSLFKIPLGVYSLSGRDTTKFMNRTFRRIGEKPVIFDSTLAKIAVKDLETAMQNAGYLRATADFITLKKGKKLSVIYQLHPQKPYYIGTVKYDIQDENIKHILHFDGQQNLKDGLKSGSMFTIQLLDQERGRITKVLLDSGFYRFHKDFIVFEADSSQNNKINLVVKLSKYRITSNSPETNHPRYYVSKIHFSTNDGSKIHIRPTILHDNTAIKEGEPFSASDLQKTYNNFARLQSIKYTNISFTELPDTSLLDCEIQLSHRKPSTISFQPEGTNTAGDFGAAGLLTYQNRNLFRGSEVLSLQVRGAYEAITGLEGYKDQNYQEYSAEAKLLFPRFVAPFLSDAFRRQNGATSEFSISYNLQNRPEFHRRVFSNTFRYRWTDAQHPLSYRLDLLDLNYIYMPWISDTFKQDYLDNVGNINAILRYNYENLLIMKLGFGISYNNGKQAIIANIETAGNLLNGLAHAFSFPKNDSQQFTLFNTAFAEYVKGDFDYTQLIKFDSNNSLALHAGVGIAYPYGNSSVLPFEKRYFAGGANSVRGWSVRELGPGSFKGTNGSIDFINQTGDMKLNLNVEYRTKLFWKFNGAAFIDAGNIWTLRNYEDQPGGQFLLNEFYKQIAVSYGLGLRLNFDYFILRLDMGMKAVNPAYTTKEDHYAFLYPDFSRDFTLHFAVGLPF